MQKILESKFLAPILGVGMYIMTMAMLMTGIMPEFIELHNAQAAHAPVEKKEEKLWEPEPRSTLIYEPTYQEPDFSGVSWEFYNPQLSELIEDLKQEKKDLFDRSQHLDMVEKRILNEKKELEALQSNIERLRNEFDSYLLFSTDRQESNLRKTADVIRTMEKKNAVALISSMPLSEAVRLMGFFTPDETAGFFEYMTTSGDEGVVLAAEISAGLRRSYIEDMEIPDEPEVEVKLDTAESDRLVKLADFYTSIGIPESYEILKTESDERLVKILLHMAPTVQSEFLSLMADAGGADSRRAGKLTTLIHEANHNSDLQKTLDKTLFHITREESRQLKETANLLANLEDQEMLTYLSEHYRMIEIAKLFKHLDKDRQDQLMLKVIKEENFGEKRSRELAELMNRMDLEIVDEPQPAAPRTPDQENKLMETAEVGDTTGGNP